MAAGEIDYRRTLDRNLPLIEAQFLLPASGETAMPGALAIPLMQVYATLALADEVRDLRLALVAKGES